nr:dirigent protein 9-like [Lolium perenne]
MVTGVVASAADLTNGNSVLGSTSVNLVADNSNNNIPSVNAGGAAPQNALFGTTTIIDEDLTESHTMPPARRRGRWQPAGVPRHDLEGRHQQDGRPDGHVIGGGEVHGDTLSFVGVHRMVASAASHVTIIGGTRKYQNAKGFAAIQTLQTHDQHTTDGGKNMLQFNVHLS